MVLSIYLATVVSAITIFYSIIIVSLLVPILGGLFVRRAGSCARRWRRLRQGCSRCSSCASSSLPVYRWADPALSGVLAAAAAYFIVLLVSETDSRNV